MQRDRDTERQTDKYSLYIEPICVFWHPAGAAATCRCLWLLSSWRSEGNWLLVKVLRPTQHKIGHFEDIPQANLWLGMEKQNRSQQKHTFTNQKKCTTAQNKHKKTKARLSHLRRHLAWKQTWLILVLGLQKFVTYLLT